MSNKQELQKAVKALTDSKNETADRVNKAVQTVQQNRKDSEAQSNR